MTNPANGPYRIVLLGREAPKTPLPGKFIPAPEPSPAELEDRAMAAYDPTSAGAESVGIAVRLGGRAAIAIQERTRSILVESESSGTAAVRSLLDWALHDRDVEPTIPVRRRDTPGRSEQIAVLHRERTAAAFPNVEPRRSWLLFPGSFHPFHAGHARLAAIAHELTGLPVDFELSVRNVDKPPLHYRAINERIGALLNPRDRPDFYGSVWLTSAPTFLEKARAFPGPIRFIVGMDTIVRIGDVRYYQDADDHRRVLRELAEIHQASFLAFPRNQPDGRLNGHDTTSDLPPRLQAMTQLIPVDRVRDVLDVSSRAIRAASAGALLAPPGPTNLALMGAHAPPFLVSLTNQPTNLNAEDFVMANHRTGEVTLKGTPITLSGPKLKPGDKAPDFQCATGMTTTATLADTPAKARLFSVVPSLDTPVCSIQTKKFNDALSALGDKVAAYTVSVDTPFAIGRFCGEFQTCSFHPLSDTRDHSFGRNYGVLIDGLALPLLARAIFVVDASNTITYVEIVPEIAQEPNYDAALAALKAAAGA